MSAAEVFFALIALLFLGAWGWGATAVTLARRAGWETAHQEVGPALQILLGVALFLSVGGFLVCLDIARVQVLVAWHVVGVVLLLARTVVWARGSPAFTLRSVLLTAGIAVVSGGLFLVSLASALGTALYNANDDDGAYIYLAQRLLSTGGLTDPFNQRRLASYGGSTLYQSLFLHYTGTSSIRGFELVFGALLVLAVVVRTARRRWLLVGVSVIGVALLLGHGVGPITNLSPEFSVAALSLGTYQLLTKVSVRSDHNRPFVYVFIGVLLAGILSLRFSFAISVGIAILIVVVTMHGARSIRSLLLVGSVGVVASAGWAIASFRSSRTPFFPLIAGNYNTSWPGGRNPYLVGTGWFTHLFRAVISENDLAQVTVLSVMIGLLYVLLAHRLPVRMLVLLAVGVGCLVQLAVLVYSFSGSHPHEILRFEAPSTLGCGLFAIDALWLCRGGRPGTKAADHAAGRHRGVVRWLSAVVPIGRLDISSRSLRHLASNAIMTVLLAIMIAVTLGYSVAGWVTATRTSLRAGYQVLDHSNGFIDRYAPLRPEYRSVNSMIPAGAKVLAAVDYPALLDLAKYDVATLDIAGSVSPAPHMPFFRGPLAKVSYLRTLGYQYIVADSPLVSGLYNLQAWKNNLRGSVYVYKAWTPYFIDWQNTLTWLEGNSRFVVRYAGTLAVIWLR